MNNITKLIITPLSRESVTRLLITPAASPVSGIDRVTVSRVATPFSGVARFVISALSVLLVLSASAQNVGDYLINEKTASTGRVTLRSWPKGANTLWGTDANGLPQKIILGAGLSLGSGSLIATAPSTISWSTITSKPNTLAGYGIADSLTAAAAASAYAPLSHTQAISTISGLQAALDGKVSAVEPSIDSALTITDINDPANNGAELNGIIIRSNRENIVEFQQQIIFGNGDKTGRIVAPALVGDYVWSLPQATGRVMLDSDDSGGLDASRLTSGTVARARLGAGTADSTTYLRGDGTWSAITGYLTPSAAAAAYAPLTHAQTWSTITSTPVTLAGYGITDAQPLDSDLTAIAALTTTTYGRSLLAAADAAGLRSLAGLGTLVATAGGVVSTGGASTLTLGTDPRLFQANTGRPLELATTGGTVSIFEASATFPRLGFSTSANNTNPDTQLARPAAGVVAQRRGTDSQRLEVANTFTSATNNECAVIDWKTTSNTLRIGTDKGSGGGSSRAVQIIMGGVVKITLLTDGNVLLHGLPTSAPATSNAVWRDDANGGALKQVP